MSSDCGISRANIVKIGGRLSKKVDCILISRISTLPTSRIRYAFVDRFKSFPLNLLRKYCLSFAHSTRHNSSTSVAATLSTDNAFFWWQHSNVRWFQFLHQNISIIWQFVNPWIYIYYSHVLYSLRAVTVYVLIVCVCDLNKCLFINSLLTLIK